MIDRVERLTNLVALLLETSAPLTLVEIAGALDGQYPDKEATRRAAFERDKAALRAIGVPIETVVLTAHQAGVSAYWIDRDRYELGDLNLEPDEMRALQVAVAAVRPTAGQDALWKLGVDARRWRPRRHRFGTGGRRPTGAARGCGPAGDGGFRVPRSAAAP